MRIASGECDWSDLEKFEIWRSASPHNALAYEWEHLVWERTERLKALRPAGDDVDSLLLTTVITGERHEALPTRQQRWLQIAKPLAIAASVLFVCAAAWLLLNRGGEPTVYATAVGERRIVDLEDGSRLELNTNTEVSVLLSRSERNVSLVRGESLFDVHPDASRPFKVAIGDSTVRAVGTAFNIRRGTEATTILVTEGVVEVIGFAGPGRAPFNVRLPAGSIGIDAPEGIVSRVIAAGELERALSWRFGSIILAGETLLQAAAEFNRYNLAQIAVADPAIAGLRLGGYFNARDVNSFVDVLASTYAIDVAVNGDTIALHGTAETPARVRDSGMAFESM